jgi:hypothetical protein
MGGCWPASLDCASMGRAQCAQLGHGVCSPAADGMDDEEGSEDESGEEDDGLRQLGRGRTVVIEELKASHGFLGADCAGG